MKLQRIGVTNQSIQRATYEKNNVAKSNVNFAACHLYNIGAGSAKGTVSLAHNANASEAAVLTLEKASQFAGKLVDYILATIKGDSKPQILIGTTGAVGKGKVTIGNIFGHDGKDVGTVYFKDLEQAVRKSSPVDRFEVTNDGFPQALNDLLTPEVRAMLDEAGVGNKVVVKFGAGGCGSYDVTHLPDGYLINTTQKGHLSMNQLLSQIEKDMLSPILNPVLNKDFVPSIEDAAVSVKSTIRNFAKALGHFDDDAIRLANTAEGRIPTDYFVELDLRDKEQFAQATALKKLTLGNKPLGGMPLFAHSAGANSCTFNLLEPKNPNRIILEKAHANAKLMAMHQYFNQLGMLVKAAVLDTAHPKVAVTSSIDRYFAKAAEEVGLNPNKIAGKAAHANLDKTMQDAVNPEELGIEIIKTGDPGRQEVAELIFAAGSEPYGPKIAFVPKSAFPSESNRKIMSLHFNT